VNKTCLKPFTLNVNSPVLFKISDYGTIQPFLTPDPTGNASALPNWNGTWTAVSGLGCYQNPDPFSIQGKAIYQQPPPDGQQILICGSGPPFNNWVLTVSVAIPGGPGFAHAWQGNLLAHVTADGTYNRIDGTDLRATLIIVPG